MKKLIVYITLFMVCITANSQMMKKTLPKENPFPMLKGVTTLNYRFDYSKMTIEMLNAKEYINGFVYNDEEDADVAFKKFTKILEKKFIAEVNKEIIKKYKLDNSQDLPFEVVIYFTTADEDGGHKIIGEVIDKENKKVLREINASASGGRWNTFEKLFLEELEKRSKKFAMMLTSHVLDIANAKKYNKK